MGVEGGPDIPPDVETPAAPGGACSTTQVPSSGARASRTRATTSTAPAEPRRAPGRVERRPSPRRWWPGAAPPEGRAASTARSALTASVGRIPIRIERCRAGSSGHVTSAIRPPPERRPPRPRSPGCPIRPQRSATSRVPARGRPRARSRWSRPGRRPAARTPPSARSAPAVTSWQRLSTTGVSRTSRRGVAGPPRRSAKPNTQLRSSAGRGWSRRCASTTTPERAQGAHVELGDVVAGDVLDHPPAALDDRAVGPDHGHAQEEVAHRPVPRPVGSGRAGGDQASDGRMLADGPDREGRTAGAARGSRPAPPAWRRPRPTA